VLYVGTSGWQYAHWKGGLYPDDLPEGRWLERYAAAFQTVEVNSTFYRLPSETTFAAWAEHTPEDFVVALKMSRFLTHVKRLEDPAEPVARLLARAARLGPKLGPVLLQLPPTLRGDAKLLDDALACFPAEVRVAVEPRESSWFSDAVAEVLGNRGAALCLADRPGWDPPRWRTTGWGYVRLHEGQARARPCYGRPALDRWAAALAERFSPEADVFAYFNNDARGCAPRDAGRFARCAERKGLRPTRAPAPGAVGLTG
jgi:uncharacterized protein YecE (DUF72 family)